MIIHLNIGLSGVNVNVEVVVFFPEEILHPCV